MFETHLTEAYTGKPCKKHYAGKPLESGGTSIAGKAAPGVKLLFNKGHIKTGQKVLDYGAGKYGRNCSWLRNQGCQVYGYDPFNGVSNDGWSDVSKKLPKDRDFDVVFSSYVLNVVPYNIETGIIRDTKRFSKGKFYHITRNKDIFDSVKKTLLAEKDNIVKKFFIKEFATLAQYAQLKENDLHDETIEAFCCFGVQTSRGFQRIPHLQTRGYSLLKSTSGWKVYSN